MDYIKDLEKQFPKSMANVYCGAALPKGWLALVKEVLPILEEHGAKVAQIKEKFGGLRLYFDMEEGRSDADYRLCQTAVSEAESKSFKVCEECAGPGIRTNIGGWMLTLCDPCKNGREEQNRKEIAGLKAKSEQRKAERAAAKAKAGEQGESSVLAEEAPPATRDVSSTTEPGRSS